MLTVALQQGINGLVLGSLYVLVALGLTLIYGVLVQINFAHADIVTLGAFAAYFFTHAFGGSYLPSIAVALVVGAALGFLINAAVFAPLRERGNELLPLIATIGVSVMLENVMLAWFGPIPYAFDSPYSEQVIRFGGMFFTVQSVLIIAVSAAAIGLLYAFMKFTFLGKALRAVAQDRETAGLMGINPNRVFCVALGVALALAGAAGSLLMPFYPAYPLVGQVFVLMAFVAVVLGTLGNIVGALVASLMMGVAESLGVQFVGADSGLIVVFVMLLLTLALRPNGLFGGWAR